MTMTTETGLKAGGIWIALGSLLLVIGLVIHPEEGATVAETQATVADETTTWRTAHWLVAAALVFIAAGFLLVVTTHSRFTHTWLTTTAWTVTAVSALVFIPGAVMEATVVPDAAAAGVAAQFEMWHNLVMGLTTVFLVMFVAGLLIAWNEFTAASPATPKWAAALGSLGALAGIVAYVGTVWYGIDALAPVWFVQLLQPLWFVWLGWSMTQPRATTTMMEGVPA